MIGEDSDTVYVEQMYKCNYYPTQTNHANQNFAFTLFDAMNAHCGKNMFRCLRNFSDMRYGGSGFKPLTKFIFLIMDGGLSPVDDAGRPCPLTYLKDLASGDPKNLSLVGYKETGKFSPF